MQSSHAPLYLSGTDVLDLCPFFVLDEYTRKKTNQIRTMQEHVRLLQWHAVIDTTCQVLHPHAVLTTHMLFLATFLFLAP